MTREERLAEIAKELTSATYREREAKADREHAKEEFFRLIRDRHKNSDLLPVQTVEVPLDFFERTGMTKEEFAESRFPGWTVEHCERNIAQSQIVFVLKRDASYIPDDIVVDGVKVSKSIAEYTPEIDWDTLRIEDEALFDKLAEPQIVYNVNEENFERMMEESPEELAKLQRHLKLRKPALKVNVREVKDERS